MNDYQHILFEHIGDVVFIRLNNPDTLNAMHGDMGRELSDALFIADDSARAVILGSTGRAFSSGANLSNAQDVATDSQTRDVGTLLDEVYNPLILQMKNLNIPLVTAIRGAAAGVSCGFSLMGDIIIAGQNAFFLQPFCNIGLSVDGGTSWLLTKTIGRVKAMEIMLLGERYPAKQAFMDGLITRLVNDDDVDQCAIDMATKLASGPKQSLSFIRKAAWHGADNTLEQVIAYERILQRQAGRTDDFSEGVRAFLEKRQANFKG